MAYVAQTSIKSVEHMEHAVGYVANPNKALNIYEQKDYLAAAINSIANVNLAFGENATFLNCTADNTYQQFEMVRQSYGQDKGVIAHHYYQSFSPEDHIAPEQAHKIGVELASKMFDGYQCVVTTHIDKNHIHNHILLNSCHMETGLKWHSNKKTLNAIRNESDRLCKRYGMSVIASTDTIKAIDKTTYQLAMQGKSWKVQLVNDLDEAISSCSSKKEFEAFFHERGYECKYTAHHITLKKAGEKKGIRVDTLAKQFGSQYTKEQIERAMGYSYQEVELTAPREPVKRQTSAESKNHWERLTEKTFAERNPEAFCKRYPKGWYQTYEPPVHQQLHRRFPVQRVRFNPRGSVVFGILEILLLFDRMINRKNRTARHVYQFRQEPPRQHQTPNTQIAYGTIPYRKLIATHGDNYSVTVNAAHILKLANRPLLYAAQIDREKETATITVKAADKEYLAKILGMEEIKERLDAQSKRNLNRAAYRDLKRKAEISGQELRYMKVSPQQLAALQEQCQEISYIEKDTGITVTYLSDDEELMKSILAPKKEHKPESEQHRNNRIYAELKKAAALENVKLRYKANVSKAQIEALIAMGIKLAYFPNPQTPELYKIAYSGTDAKKLNEFLYADADKDGIPDRIDSARLIHDAEDAGKKRT